MLKIEVEQHLVNAVATLVRKGNRDERIAAKEYLEDMSKGLKLDKSKLLMELVKENLYHILEKKVIEELIKVGDYQNEK